MSNMYKTLDFLGNNTIKGLAAPTADDHGVRYVDLTTAQAALAQSITTGDTTESQARTSAVSTLTSSLAAQIATLDAAYQAADTNLTSQLNTQIQAVISGFTIKDPVYAIVNSAIALSGLAIDTLSFTGTVPDGSRILAIAQGGSISVAHPDNRIWIANAGAWTAAPDFDNATEIVRSVLISVENGADNFVNSIYSLIEPAIFANTVVGTTGLRWARWQGNDRVVADGTSLSRTGITFAARLDSTDLILNSNGIAVNPVLKALLQDLGSATGSLPVAQVQGLLAYVLAITLNQFAAPTTTVSFANQKLSNLADATLATDAVNLQVYQAGLTALESSLQSSVSSVNARDFKADLTTGVVVGSDTVFTITHGLNSIDLIKEVFDKTNGQTVDTDFARVVTDVNNLNSCKVTFANNTSVSTTQFRLLVRKIG